MIGAMRGGLTGLAICGAAAALLALVRVPSHAMDLTGDAAAVPSRPELLQARKQAARARDRAANFERQAEKSGEAANKALLQAAALAAKVQRAEASLSEAEASLAIVAQQRAALDRRLAVQRQPIADLTAALAAVVRRPMVLALLRPTSLQDTVHLNAILAGTIPRIRTRTAQLRSELDDARALELASRDAAAHRRAASAALTQQRSELAAYAARESIVARRATGSADREAARAFALAEQARNLGGLVERIEQAGSLRARLAALPGPVLRPSDPSRSVMPVPTRAVALPQDAPQPYDMPVIGRIRSGFGETARDGESAEGLTFAPAPLAQVVAPGAGRIAFAGPYRGYGQIVIIEHSSDWTSLVTGLASLDVGVGEKVVAGSPLGNAASSAPAISLELRHQGTPVNPMPFLH